MERWTAASPWADPDRATGEPAATRSPVDTSTSDRYETDTLNSPLSMVTVSIPATDPANDTRPSRGATTVVPGSAARSMPQWPAYAPSGANSATTGPGTGATRQTRPTAIHIAVTSPAGPVVLLGPTYKPDGAVGRDLRRRPSRQH